MNKCLLDEVHRIESRPVKDRLALSPTGHFMIHYDIEGDAAPDLIDSDQNGVPDYVDEVGLIADSTRKVLIEVMGFLPEVSDSDGIYDIYIMAFGSNYYGVNVNEGSGKSYIKIDNDYSSGFYTTGIKVMRLTVAHEFFHAIQRAYKSTQSTSDQFFYELTSTWIEDIIVPDGDDYLYWINDFFNDPQQSWDETDGYSLALFGHYLSTQYENITSEKESTIIREVWELIGNGNSPYEALNAILQNSFDSSFQVAWLDFVSRNLFNEIYSDMENNIFYYIDQAEELCTAPLTSVLYIDVDDVVSRNLLLANNAVTIQTIKSREDGVLQLNVAQSGGTYLGDVAYFLNNKHHYSLSDNIETAFVVPSYEKNEKIQFVYIGTESSTSMDLNIDISYIPNESKFLSIYPNPIYFGDASILEVDIGSAVIPKIKIYNLLGVEILEIDTEFLDKGRHKIPLKNILNSEFSSGVYVIDLILGDKVFTRKFSFVK